MQGRQLAYILYDLYDLSTIHLIVDRGSLAQKELRM